MARKTERRRSAPETPKSGGLTSSDFTVDLEKPEPSPLDFVNRKMAEQERKEGDARGAPPPATERP